MPTADFPHYMEEGDQRRLEELQRQVIEQQFREAQERNSPQHDHTHHITPQGPWDVGIAGQNVVGTATTWNDNTTTMPWDAAPGNVQISDPPAVHLHNHSPAIDKETLKEALKEALGEMFDEDVNFINWLRLKYTLIPVTGEAGSRNPVNPEKKTKKRRKRNVNRPISQSVPASRAGLTGSAIGNAGDTPGSASVSASLRGVSLRSDVQSGARSTERSAPPDQGSR